jgi:hypothetical protein
MKQKSVKTCAEQELYKRQNRMIHLARAQLGMSLDECRDVARGISGKGSISSLSLPQRWELIEVLKARGADVYNPLVPKALNPTDGNPHPTSGSFGMGKQPVLYSGGCSVEVQRKPTGIYHARLAYWNKRFPKCRRCFASNRQLAWIETLWELDFDDGRMDPKRGLRRFLWRQTKNLEHGPVSDLSFLREQHVGAVITPLKKRAEERLSLKSGSLKRLRR